MNDSEDWYDVTVVGSVYEEQVSRSGAWRHRPLNFSNLARGDGTAAPLGRPLGVGDWRDGPAPELK